MAMGIVKFGKTLCVKLFHQGWETSGAETLKLPALCQTDVRVLFCLSLKVIPE